MPLLMWSDGCLWTSTYELGVVVDDKCKNDTAY